MERIRQELGIEDWIVFGGSWGATLSLIYAQAHPERVACLVLRGVFLMMQRELDWFYGGGAGQFWPEQWDRFAALVPEEERDDLIAAYHKRLFSGDRATEVKFARAWAAWENALASMQSNGTWGEPPCGLCPRVFAIGEPLFHQCRLSGDRRADPEQHGKAGGYSRFHRPGPL